MIKAATIYLAVEHQEYRAQRQKKQLEITPVPVMQSCSEGFRIMDDVK